MINTSKRIKKIASWIFILSIASLLIVSFLPWISITENSSTNEKLYFNSIMIERSDNDQIRNLAGDLNLISDLLWMAVIFALIILVGLVINLTEKYLAIGKIMTYLGCATLLLSILIVHFQLNFIDKVNQINQTDNTVSLASALPFVYYAYIPLIFDFLLLICSAVFTIMIILFIIKQSRLPKEERKKINEKKSVDNLGKVPEKQLIPKKISPSFKIEEKRVEVNDRPKEKDTQKIGIQTEPKKETRQSFEKEIILNTELNEEKKSIETKKEIAEPFPAEKPKEKTKESDEVHISKQFEEALSSAIEKKQIGIKQQETPAAETEKKKIETKGKIIVRCPQCSFTFSTEKGEGITNIKCPECGKEGIIR